MKCEKYKSNFFQKTPWALSKLKKNRQTLKQEPQKFKRKAEKNEKNKCFNLISHWQNRKYSRSFVCFLMCNFAVVSI